MSKREAYREKLRTLDRWEPFLLSESGLPGPRANLELAQAAADEGDEALFRRLIAHNPEQAPVNSPEGFLVVCGVIGLGRLLAEGHADVIETLRGFASDPRWRVREGVAMALQRLGDHNMTALLTIARTWSRGS